MKRTCMFLFVLAFSVLAATAHAQVTSLTLNSDPGDFIGGGQSLFLTPADGTFNATTNFDSGVSVSFFGPTHFWFLDFAAAGHVPLTVGTYTGATRFPFQAFSEPGLSVDGDGRGCNTLTGSFTVVEINYGAGGGVNSFDALFEQHCEGATPALRGEIRFNAHPVVTVFAP